MSNFYGATGLIGGATGALDRIDGASLADGDGALVITATGVLAYTLDADSAAAESSPGVIAPDANGGDKRWILQSPVGVGYVNRENPTVDHEQIYIDSNITSIATNKLIDSTATFQTWGVQAGDYVCNTVLLTYQRVLSVDSETQLTMDADQFPNNDGSRYYLWHLGGHQQVNELDLSGIIDAGARLVKIKIHHKTNGASSYFEMWRKGETGENKQRWTAKIANQEMWDEILVVPDASGICEYKNDDVRGEPDGTGFFFKMTIVGWWM